MRKIVARFAASLDRYIEGHNGEYDWILIDKEIDFASQMERFDTYFFGRKSYEKILPMGGKPVPGITNYVFSQTLTTVHQNFIMVQGDFKKQVKQIKNQEGKDIAIFGGASLLASLLDAGLVDEISIAVIPVMLGKGKPMVAQLKAKVWLSLLNSKTYGNGTIQLNYQVTKKRPK